MANSKATMGGLGFFFFICGIVAFFNGKWVGGFQFLLAGFCAFILDAIMRYLWNKLR